MNRTRRTLLIAAVVVAVGGAALAALELPRGAVANGGGSGTAATRTLSGTIAQPLAHGPAASGARTLVGGVQGGVPAGSTAVGDWRTLEE